MFEKRKFSKLGTDFYLKGIKKKHFNQLTEFEIEMYQGCIPVFYEQGFYTHFSQEEKTFFFTTNPNKIDVKRLQSKVSDGSFDEMFKMFQDLSEAFCKDGNPGYTISILNPFNSNKCIYSVKDGKKVYSLLDDAY